MNALFGYETRSMIEPKESKSYFLNQLKQSNLDFEKLTTKEFIEQGLSFYKNTRIKGVHFNEDGDMLLIQWGIYSLEGTKQFQFDITRQFIESANNEDSQMSQFHLTLIYPAMHFLEVENGNEWFDHPNLSFEIRSLIENLPFYPKILEINPTIREIIFEFL